MKKLLFLTILFTGFLLANSANAAIGSTCVWEIRSGATANNVNGGGYTSGGTDYSQQDAAQLNNTDFATAGAANTTLTSATGGFTAAMAGNIIHLTAGTNLTVGWYEITAYTDTNTVTLDRAPDDTVGGVASATGYVGGALSFASSLDSEFAGQVVAGNKIWIKAGTYTLTENIISAADGTALLPIVWEGYNTSRDDDPVGDNRPLIAAGAYDWDLDNYIILKNIRFTITDWSGVGVDNNSFIINCKSTNSSGTANRQAFHNIPNMYKCECISTNGRGLYQTNVGHASFCYFHDSAQGMIVGGYGCSVINNIFDTCTIGINQSTRYGTNISNNTIYNCTTGISGTTGHSFSFLNNIVDNCTTGANWTSAIKNHYIDYNLWSNNGTDVVNVTKGDNAVTSDITLTDPANGDFTLPSGAAAIDAGLQPSTDIGVVGDYKWNIGVDQDDVTAAGGGGGGSGFFFIQ